ncbi:MAG: hypothetical protein GFH27_549321n106 [Chloroflexi bacterium AL-W]|nr:hypothetical protein [Chloroflexi bacterium AL-N1]NOK64984.1 hypothetical protein [Chloroflexi bacterium AL-N10]NOK76754.1 hypothetical protein [Chloroflexi bacterium AL-N5]NOK84645.1 hypothetical protein [Chloroflexi bacterium AL-W]NOK86530.1 hypothetical protein [Chloroflexi bacterium AL-N15]
MNTLDTASAPQPVDLIIYGGQVVTMDANDQIYTDGAIAIKDGTITAVGPTAQIREQYMASKTIDAHKQLVLPGFVDSHAHPGMAPLIGSFKQDPSQPSIYARGGNVPYIMTGFSSMVGRSLPEELTRITSTSYLITMLKSGTTCFADGGWLNPSAVAQAVKDVGIRGSIAPMIIDTAVDPANLDQGTHRVADADELLATMETLVAQWHGAANDRIRVIGNIFWPLLCSDELCKGMRDLCNRHNIGYNSHAAAVLNENDLSVQLFGKRTIARLAELEVLGPRFQAIHMGFVNDEEIQQLVETDTKVAHNPLQNAFAGKGITTTGAILNMMDAGVTVGIGTDGGGGFIGNMLESIRTTVALHRDMAMDNSRFPLMQAFAMATRDSARCSFWDDRVGTLENGMAADLLLVDVSNSRYAFDDTPHLWFLYSGHEGEIKTVLIDGEVVVEDGRVVTVDEEQIVAQAQEAMQGFRAQFGA